MKFVFADGEKLGVYENGKKTLFESAYIAKYKENALRLEKNKEWKKSTDVMMSDEYYFETEDESQVFAEIKSVALTADENKLLYSFCVNGTSGIYYKYTDDKEKTEAHFISSNDVEFSDIYSTKNGEMLGKIQKDYVTSNVALFSKNGGDYKTLTAGDSLDENPSFSKDGNVLFNSYAVGRDANNKFISYLPSEIYKLNLKTLDVEELVTSDVYSYIKPIEAEDKTLYCIRKPFDDEKEENVFLQILLIPVRIVQAIVGFISAFVMCFAKKPMISGQSARSIGNGGDAAKYGKADAKKIFVNNSLIQVDKELKKNKKSEEYGFIPKSWKLVKLIPNEEGKFDECKEYELASGVADFCLIEENGEKTLIYTNGKRVFEVKDFGETGKKEKLFETDFCLKVGGIQETNTQECDEDLFNAL